METFSNRKGFGHIAFHVENVKEVLNRLLQNGGTQLGEMIETEISNSGYLTFVYAKVVRHLARPCKTQTINVRWKNNQNFEYIENKMRKVILSLAVSLDGYIAKPNGDAEWLKKIHNPEKLDYGFSKFYETIDITIMGNSTYKEILGFNIPFQDKENFVISRTDNPDTEFVHFTTDISSLVRNLKSKNGKDIWLIGGGQINTEFLNKGLIDELLIRIVPIVIGEGLTLFANKPDEKIFELITSEAFSTGVVQLTYRPRKK